MKHQRNQAPGHSVSKSISAPRILAEIGYGVGHGVWLSMQARVGGKHGRIEVNPRAVSCDGFPAACVGTAMHLAWDISDPLTCDLAFAARICLAVSPPFKSDIMLSMPIVG